MRIAYERSFVAADAILMHWLWQRSFGWLWIIGRALLTLYRWPIVGGLFVAVLLTGGSWLVGYCLHLPQRWRWTQYLPAAAWMIWTAHVGINLYYYGEPGRILAIPFLLEVALGVWAVIKGRLSSQPTTEVSTFSLWRTGGEFLVILLCFALPTFYLCHRHPFLRPLTKMQVQLLNNDYAGMSETAHEHPDMCNRQMAGYYAIALAHTGHLADQLFDIKLEFDTLRAYSYGGKPNPCLNYHIIDCDYHAGLIRAARHYAMEDLTLNGPSLFSLKSMTKISLLDGDWMVARKYLHILRQAPFESEFCRKYEPIVGHPELVQADPEFAAIIKMMPPHHSLEQFYLKPGFVGYYAETSVHKDIETLTWSAIACLYGKRMPQFLNLCEKFIGTTPPRSIAEGLIIQAYKNPDILKAFPQLQMGVNRFELFLQDANPYMADRKRGAEALFKKYKGYYPYYYFFGNLRSTRQPGDDEQGHNKAGVN